MKKTLFATLMILAMAPFGAGAAEMHGMSQGKEITKVKLAPLPNVKAKVGGEAEFTLSKDGETIHFVLRAVQCFYAGFLHKCIGTRVAIYHQLCYNGRKFLVHDSIPCTPSGHCVCFRKTIENDCPFLESRNFCNRKHLWYIVSYPRVNFVGKNESIPVFQNLCNCLDISPRNGFTCWISRGIYNDKLCPVGHQFFEFFQIDLKFILHL